MKASGADRLSGHLPLGAIALLAFILPIAHTPALRDLLAGGLAVAVLTLAWRRGLPPLPSRWMPVWAGLCFLSALWSLAPATSLKEAFLNTLAPMGCALAAARWMDRERVVGWLAWPLVLGMGLVLLVRLAYLALEGPSLPWLVAKLYYWSWPGRGVASTLAILVLPFAAWLLAGANRRLGAVLLAAALVVGSQNWNRMFWLAALVTLVPCLFMFRVGRGTLLALVAAAVLATGAGFWHAVGKTAREASETGLVVRGNLQADPRFTIWPEWVKLALERPLLGYGVGYRVMRQAAREKLPAWLYDYDPTSFSHAHNIFLSTFVQLGAIGLAVFVALLADLARRFRRRMAAGGEARAAALGGLALILGMLAKNMTDDFMHFSVAILFWLLLGTLARLAGVASPPSASPSH